MPISHAEAFHDLLNNPPGTYALTPYGSTTAIVLKGDETFRARAFNLFLTFGSERGRELPVLHGSTHVNVAWVCMTADRVRLALRLYLFARLVRLNTRDVFDAEGDFLECVCDTEDTLWEEADQLAIDFMVSHMRADYAALPIYESEDVEVEHTIGTPGAAHTSE